MKKIGYTTNHSKELTLKKENNIINDYKISDPEQDIIKIIFEYCDERIYPLITGEAREKWFLNQVEKVRIRYLEDI